MKKILGVFILIALVICFFTVEVGAEEPGSVITKNDIPECTVPYIPDGIWEASPQEILEIFDVNFAKQNIATDALRLESNPRLAGIAVIPVRATINRITDRKYPSPAA